MSRLTVCMIEMLQLIVVHTNLMISKFLFKNIMKVSTRKGLTFNRDCSLMLIGFSWDYWSMSYIQDAIKSFEKLLVWEKDLNNVSHIIIKARVLDLDHVPKSIQITNGDGFLSESWIVSCEIVYQTLLGGGPPDEDSPQ